MGMPKTITHIHKDKGFEKELSFEHALRLLKLEEKNNTKSFSLKGKYIFNGNDIIRQQTTGKDQERKD